LFCRKTSRRFRCNPGIVQPCLYKKPAVTKAIAKDIQEPKEVVQKAPEKKEQIVDKVDATPKVSQEKPDDKKMVIEMEFIDGDLVRDILDDLSEKERKKSSLA